MRERGLHEPQRVGRSDDLDDPDAGDVERRERRVVDERHRHGREGRLQHGDVVRLDLRQRFPGLEVGHAQEARAGIERVQEWLQARGVEQWQRVPHDVVAADLLPETCRT